MADNDEPTIVDLSQYPPMFNDTTVSFFPEIENTPKNIEQKHQSESGKDVIQSIRTDKLSATVNLSVANDDWVRFFYGLFIDEDNAVTFKQYSPILQGYETRTIRITNFKYKKVKKSERLPGVVGVWEMSFNIEEF